MPDASTLPAWGDVVVRVTEPRETELGYAVYTVAVEKLTGELCCRATRRYREFAEAFKTLQGKAELLSPCGRPLPKIPPKQYLGRVLGSGSARNTLERRRRGFEAFLNEVIKRPELTSTPEFLGLLGLGGSGGYLQKLTEKKFGRSSFHTRWFEVGNGVMSYKHRQDHSPFRATISLSNVRVLDCESHPHGFCVIGPNLPRAFVLRARSDDEKNFWVRRIQAEIEKCEKSASGGVRQWVTGDESDFTASSGSCNYYTPGSAAMRLDDFDIHSVIGVGSFGKVFKVRAKDSTAALGSPLENDTESADSRSSAGGYYALKLLDKHQIRENRMITHTLAERDILHTAIHPFIVTLHCSFQTRSQLVLVMDFLPGGDLFFHLQQCKRFPEQRVRQYAAEIALALTHLHGLGVIYRDLKSENIVLDRHGHAVLTDFGLAKNHSANGERTYTFCGTPEYMAPELVRKQGHTAAVDWWSLGVLMIELTTGAPPFYSPHVPQIFSMILNKPLDLPAQLCSPDFQSLAHALVHRDPQQRMQTLKDFRRHPYFACLSFDDVMLKRVPMPWIPDPKGEDDARYFDSRFTALSASTYVGDDGDNSSSGDMFGCSDPNEFYNFSFERGRSPEQLAM